MPPAHTHTYICVNMIYRVNLTRFQLLTEDINRYSLIPTHNQSDNYLVVAL